MSYFRAAGVRLVFAAVATGDAIFVDTGSALYLIDCGAGLDYSAMVRSLGHRALAGLVLTHAHMDHWLALPEVLALLADDGWVARPGTCLAPELMKNQRLFEFFNGQVDCDAVLRAWNSLPARPIPHGLILEDANIEFSSPEVVLENPDSIPVHRACIVPVLRWAGRVAVFGADLDAAEWPRIAGLLPQGIDVFQAPNHGGPPGRMERWVLDAYLRPRIVVVTDAQPFPDDHVEWYSAPDRNVYTLQRGHSVQVELGNKNVFVSVSQGAS